MLRRVALPSFELWEVLDHSLHIFNRVKLSLALLRLEEVLNECLNLLVQITVVRVEHFSEEGVIA